MGRIKSLLRWIGSWQYAGLSLLLALTLVMHFSVIMQPAQPIFDEQFYVPDARNIIA